MAENKGPTPAAGSWLSGAYLPPDHVDTGPIPAITDDMTAEDVARLSETGANQVASDESSSAADASGTSGDPETPEVREVAAAEVPEGLVVEAGANAEGSGGAEETAVHASDGQGAGAAHDSVRTAAEVDPSAVTAVFAAPAVVKRAVDAEPAGTGADADPEPQTGIDIRADTDIQADTETQTGTDIQADPDPDPDPDTDAKPEPEVQSGAEPADADAAETEVGDGRGPGGSADDDPAAVTTMFTVVTEHTREDAETTSFAVVAPDAAGVPETEAAAVKGTGAGAPAPRRQRSRAVLVSTAGAVAVVVLGVAAAAAFGGEQGGVPVSAPVTSAPAASPAASPTPTTPPAAFPRYPGTKSPALGRIVDRKARLSYSRLGGKWSYGLDKRKLSAALGVSRKGPQLRGIMQAGRAEYLSAPLPAALGDAATPEAALAVARKVIGTGQSKAPTVRAYAVEPLTGGLNGWLAGFQVLSGPTDGEIVAVAVVDTGAARPGVLYVGVPRGDKTVRQDIRPLVRSLRVAR